jgi:hypothetical protein
LKGQTQDELYQYGFSKALKFELLNIANSIDWVERFFELIERLNPSDSENYIPDDIIFPCDKE